MKTKAKALRHYDRMIEWAEKQKPMTSLLYSKGVGWRKMEDGLGEAWGSENCSYCVRYESVGCSSCPLEGSSATDYSCCEALYNSMNKSKTWKTWVKNAKLVREYIKENG